jgi:hypothetical protein
MKPTVTVAVEGAADLEIVRAIAKAVGLFVSHEYVQNSKSRLDRKLGAFNRAARFSDWLVLRDLDHDAGCAPALVNLLLPAASPRMCLRIAERSAESWLIADADGFARFFSVAPGRVPNDPDLLEDPKQELVNLCRHSSRRAIREDVVPTLGARVGPGYTGRIIEFASTPWSPHRAMQTSESLRRCFVALEQILRK